MIPTSYATRDRAGNRVVLRQQARDEAYRRMYYEIYRHRMRYDVSASAEELDLNEDDIDNIKKYYKQDEECQLPVKFVTINLPQDRDVADSQKMLDRCLKKCYVGEWAYAYELGKAEKHPHYHVYFTSTVKWLAASRIISEWSRIFNITPNFINVKNTSKEQLPNLQKYITKEGLVFKKSEKKNKK